MSEQNAVHLASPYTYIKCAIQMSVRPSVRLWTESCLFCIFHNTSQIQFIFTHINQLHKVCHVLNFVKNSKISNFGNFFKFAPLTLSFWPGIQYESIVWVIMGQRWVSSEHRHSSCSSLSISFRISSLAQIYHMNSVDITSHKIYQQKHMHIAWGLFVWLGQWYLWQAAKLLAEHWKCISPHLESDL